jgi:hypothetical protein
LNKPIRSNFSFDKGSILLFEGFQLEEDIEIFQEKLLIVKASGKGLV